MGEFLKHGPGVLNKYTSPGSVSQRILYSLSFNTHLLSNYYRISESMPGIDFFLLCSVVYMDFQAIFRLINSFTCSFIQQTHFESPSYTSCIQVFGRKVNVHWSYISGFQFSCFHWVCRQFMVVVENRAGGKGRKRCGLARCQYSSPLAVSRCWGTVQIPLLATNVVDKIYVPLGPW